MTRCKSCNAPIIFARTLAGLMPVDEAPSPDGNVELTRMHGEQRARVVTPGSSETLYKAHFATCPNAAAHRRSR